VLLVVAIAFGALLQSVPPWRWSKARNQSPASPAISV
jgi:hypothetical protein